MIVNHKTYNNLTDIEKVDFFDYLNKTFNSDNSPAVENMWHDDWQNHPNTLPYLLENTNRFSVNGEFFIIYVDNCIAACGGVYRSDFSPHISIGAVRTWTDKKSRHLSLLRETLFPLSKQWSISSGMKIMILSFNDYNKNLIQVFKRRRIGETEDRISTREPHHLFYNGLCEVEFPLNIQYTKQWVIYEKLDISWDFDWSSIKWTI